MTQKKGIEMAKKEQPIYLGIDVHKKRWSICLIDREEIVGQFTIEPTIVAIEKILSRYPGRKVHSVYEAGFSGFWLHDKLTEKGIHNIIVSPRKIPVEVGNLVKTDKRDAKKMAVALSRGLLRGNHIPTPEERATRQWMRTREAFKRKRTRAIQQLKMLLLQYDISLPKGLSRETRAILKEQAFPPAVRTTVDMLVEEADFFRKKIRILEKQAQEACKDPEIQPTYEILRSTPGIGPILASALCFEIGDFERFSSGKKLCSFLGLTPREYSSGEHTRRGRITGQGIPWLRAHLIEASWKAIAKDPNLRADYERIKRNSGSAKKAIVAIARKILLRLHAMVRKGEMYSMEKAA